MSDLPIGKLKKQPLVPNRKLRRKYDKIYRQDPMAANTFLLICELTDEKGQVETSPEELVELMAARFEDPGEYALRGRPKK